MSHRCRVCKALVVNPFPNKTHSIRGGFDYFCPECIVFYRSILAAAAALKVWRYADGLSTVDRALRDNVVICCGIGCSLDVCRHNALEINGLYFCSEHCRYGYLLLLAEPRS